MKLKLLTLVLALGLFAFGMPVNAAAEHEHSEQVGTKEKVGDVGDVVKAILCTILSQATTLPKCCTGVCGASAPDLTTLGKCVATIYAFPTTPKARCDANPKTCAWAKTAISTVQAACKSTKNVVCSGIACGLSSDVKKACGTICCNMSAPEGIETCIGDASQCTEAKYNQKDCLSPWPPSSEAQAVEGGW